MSSALVIGGGSWGTAIARLLSNNGVKTILYIRNTEDYNNLLKNNYNEKYLPGIKLNNLKFINSLNDISSYDFLIFAVPTSSFREVFQNVAQFINSNQIIVNLSKGIELTSLLRMSQIAKSIINDIKYVCLSGPSHAEEVGIDLPTTVVAASDNIVYAEKTQTLFSTENFRVYTNEDLVGVELAGATKNIIALASGMCDGLGYGDNTKAALMVRGISEITRLGIKLGAQPQTFFGLAGIGDLIVTCTSMHSRNRRAGILLGQGLSVENTINKIGMVVEGIKSTKSVYELSKSLDVEMPITEKLYDVLYANYSPINAVNDLMNRANKSEYI